MKKVGVSALIIANGDLPERALVNRLAGEADVIICADGGARHALRQRLRPDVILGDLDSISLLQRRHFQHVRILRIPDQESTDLEKAIRYCIALKLISVVIVGAIGDRLDHSTGAVGCFRKYGRKIHITLFDRAGTLSLLSPDETIPVQRGEVFSLIPLGRCTGVRLDGARYPLAGETLQLGVREGISNSATGRTVRVRHSGGTLLFYRMRLPARTKKAVRSRPTRR